ncbi:MAG: hypothetical protein ABIQ35_03265 [Verrucomicrobiota bacterium]
MKTGPVSPRRFVTGIFLLTALGMLVLGLTPFSSKLSGTRFVMYWLICFLLTGFAAILALVDVALIRRDSKRKQRELIESTLTEAYSERDKTITK